MAEVVGAPLEEQPRRWEAAAPPWLTGGATPTGEQRAALAEQHRGARRRWLVAVGVALGVLVGVGWRQAGHAAPAAGGWTPIDPPPGVVAPGASWILVDAPDGKKLVAAVYRPPGPGPHPVVVVYHGGSGLAPGFLPIAEFFAGAGFLTVVGCWQSNPTLAGLPGSGNVDCSQAPLLGVVISDREMGTPRALIAAARGLPGARGDRVGVFGTSMGGYPALAAAAFPGEVQAVVVDSGAYRPPPPAPDAVNLAKAIRTPVLILHGTADGSEPVADARAYESVARGLGNPVESHYYEGVGHPVGFRPETRDDVLARARAFFARHLVEAPAPASLPRNGGGGAVLLVGAAGLGVVLTAIGLAVRRRAQPLPVSGR